MKRSLSWVMLGMFALTHAAYAKTGNPIARSEGSSGTTGGGGTELSLAALLPETVEYRAEFRWPEWALPAQKMGDGKYAQELQIRVSFKRSELFDPLAGVRTSFYARTRRDRGEWQAISNINRVTTLTLLKLLKAKNLDTRQVDALEEENKSSELYMTEGGRRFNLNLDPGKDEAALLEVRGIPIYSYTEKRYFHADELEILIDGRPSSSRDLRQLRDRVVTHLLSVSDYSDPASFGGLALWSRLASRLSIGDATVGLDKELAARVVATGDRLYFRLLDAVSDGGVCNETALEGVRADISQWYQTQVVFHLGLDQLGFAKPIADPTSAYKPTVDMALSLIDSYCLKSELDGKDAAQKGALFEEIQQQKKALSLGKVLGRASGGNP